MYFYSVLFSSLHTLKVFFSPRISISSLHVYRLLEGTVWTKGHVQEVRVSCSLWARHGNQGEIPCFHSYETLSRPLGCYFMSLGTFPSDL